MTSLSLAQLNISKSLASYGYVTYSTGDRESARGLTPEVYFQAVSSSSRTSWVMRIGQKSGPHMEQNSDSFAPS